VICQTLAKYKTLVPGETIHPVQQPFGEVVPLDQDDRGIGFAGIIAGPK